MYLSKLSIKNFRGIQNLQIDFSEKLNIIIGENGSCKSALFDAIRILYNFSKLKKDIYVENKDFCIDKATHEVIGNIELAYEFRGLNTAQHGAFYEFLVVDKDPNKTYAKVTLKYHFRKNKTPLSDYHTGLVEGQKADYKNFELFQHYYLDALRDCTKDLANAKNNIFGKLVMRAVNKEGSQAKFEEIINKANSELLKQPAVNKAKVAVNKNLDSIYKTGTPNKIGLRLDEPKTEPFVNTLKAFLPFDLEKLEGNGLELHQNSLGHNNLVYTATILGDVSSRILEDETSHYALLIEEPEAHLHPQLQLNLFNFISDNTSDNTQTFITTHSPTLTSKAPLENLIVLDGRAYRLNECFENRETEKVIEDSVSKKELDKDDYLNRRKQLERYLDVTKSQLLFANAILFVEGISEELLIPAFCRIKGFNIQDYRIELVNVGGTSFFPFLHLFNSSEPEKRINKKVAILTDGDHFPKSKDSRYSFKKLLLNNYARLDELESKISKAKINSRVPNLVSASNTCSNIAVFNSYKTFEFELIRANVPVIKSEIEDNYLINYLKEFTGSKFKSVFEYLDSCNDTLTQSEHLKASLLFWKSILSKATFAHYLSVNILENLEEAKKRLKIPKYIDDAICHVTGLKND